MGPTERPERSGCFSSILSLVLTTYFISVSFAVPYFNWRYARDNGFMNWLCFGGVVATAQALVWPLWVFGRGPKWTDEEKANVAHYFRSKNALMKAMRVGHSTNGRGMLRFTATEGGAVVALYRLALAEARQLEPAVLKKVHPDLPEVWEAKYIGYLQGMCDIFSRKKPSSHQAAALRLYDDWVGWHRQHSDDFRIPRDVGEKEEGSSVAADLADSPHEPP